MKYVFTHKQYPCKFTCIQLFTSTLTVDKIGIILDKMMAILAMVKIGIILNKLMWVIFWVDWSKFYIYAILH